MTVLTPSQAFPGMPFPQHGVQGVILDAVGTELYRGLGSSSASYTGITVGSGLNRALVLTLGFSATATAISCTWDSGGTNQAMSQIVTQVNANTRSSAIFGLVAPTSGNKTLAISWTGAGEAFIAAISFTGVDQTGGTTSFSNSVGASASSANVTSAGGDIVVAVVPGLSNTSVAIGVKIYFDNVNGSISNSGAEYNSGKTTVSAGFTVNTTQEALCAINVKSFNAQPLTQTVQSYLYPGAVLPNPNPPPPSVLSIANAFPNLAFPQHKSGQSAVQSFLYSGAVQPIVQAAAPAFLAAWARGANRPILGVGHV